MDNRTVEEEEAKKTARIVGLAAIKYGDLSNQAGKDYIFDVDRFTSFEGNKLCAYIYEIANEFNKFYHETKILSEEDEEKRSGYIALLGLTKRVLETCIDLLGFEAPERM